MSTKTKKVHLLFRFWNYELYRKLVNYSKVKNLSMNHVINTAIEKYLDSEK